VIAAIEHNESFRARGRVVAGSHREDRRLDRSQFDPRNGGFGSQPKFPHPAALDLLLQMAMSREDEQARAAFVTTLEKMARGGIYDHLAEDSSLQRG